MMGTGALLVHLLYRTGPPLSSGVDTKLTPLSVETHWCTEEADDTPCVQQSDSQVHSLRPQSHLCVPDDAIQV